MDCKSPQFPDRPKALRTNRTPSEHRRFAQLLPPSSNRVKQSPLPRSTRPAAWPESLSANRCSPPPRLPTSPSDSPLGTLPKRTIIHHGVVPKTTLPPCKSVYCGRGPRRTWWRGGLVASAVNRVSEHYDNF